MKELGSLLVRFNQNIPLALAGYNAGPNRESLRRGEIPKIAETQNYVAKITKSLGISASPGQQVAGIVPEGASLGERNAAYKDEKQRVTYLIADQEKLAEAQRVTAAAGREQFSVTEHLIHLRGIEETALEASRRAYQEVTYWQQELAAGRVEEASQQVAMKAAMDNYTASVEYNNAARQAQLKHEEIAIRSGEIQNLVVKRSSIEMEELRGQYIEGYTALGDYNLEVAKLNMLLENNVLTVDQHSAAMEKARNTAYAAQGTYEAYFASLKTGYKEIQDAGVGVFNNMNEAMVEAFTTGKFGFNDMMKSILTDLRQAASQIAANSIMSALFQKADSKTGQTAGLLTKLAMSIAGSITGGAAGGLTSNVGGGPANWIPMAHGGTFTSSLSQGVYTRPTLFPMKGSGMRAFASGTGLLGEAGPEAVLPLVRASGGDLGVKAQTAAPVVNVIVKNLPGQDARVSQGADGQVQIEIVEQVLASKISKGGTTISRSLELAYGVRRS